MEIVKAKQGIIGVFFLQNFNFLFSVLEYLILKSKEKPLCKF